MAVLHKLWMEQYRPQHIEDYIFQNDKQKIDFLKMINNKSIPHLLLSGVQGSGKAQPLYSKLSTPTGWTTMEDVYVGMVINTPDGGTAPITSVHPQGVKDVYTITFHDGSSADCCLDHLWECNVVTNFSKQNRKTTKVVMDTKSIISYMNSSLGKNFNISIPLTSSVEFTPSNGQLHIHPYVMGVLLGDGGTTSSVKFTSADEELVERISSILSPLDYNVNCISSTGIEYSITDNNVQNKGGSIGCTENRLKTALKHYGVWGNRSWEKKIPIDYCYSSINDRLQLLQGLFDTDGTVSKTGSGTFSTSSYELAVGTQTILWSLGATCSLNIKQPKYKYKGEHYLGRMSYTLQFNHPSGIGQFFSLSRKIERCAPQFAHNHNKGTIVLSRRIKSIEYKCATEVQCIMVDHPNHLYITDDYVVTHNTTIAKIMITECDIDPTDVMVINASDENSVDVIRDKIKSFIMTYAMGDFKIVLLEEADYISGAGQAILRVIMEQYADVARFILTCNYENKIIPAIKSRCQHYRFKASDKNDIAEYVVGILVNEKIKFDLALVDKYVDVGYPDVRKIVNLLQQNCHNGILSAPETTSETGDYKFALLDLVERDKWQEARSLACSQVAAEEWEDVYRFFYENLHKAPKFGDRTKWEEGIIIIAEHLYKHTISADPEICAAAMFIRLGQL